MPRHRWAGQSGTGLYAAFNREDDLDGLAHGYATDYPLHGEWTNRDDGFCPKAEVYTPTHDPRSYGRRTGVSARVIRDLLYLASAAARALALRSSGVSFASATARAFAKFAALVNRRRSPSNESNSASSLTNCAAAALGPKPHHFPASSSEFSSENVVKRIAFPVLTWCNNRRGARRTSLDAAEGGSRGINRGARG